MLIIIAVGAFGGCTVSSFYVKSGLSPDNKFLISGSSCGNGFMWEVCDKKQTLIIRCKLVTPQEYLLTRVPVDD